MLVGALRTTGEGNAVPRTDAPLRFASLPSQQQGALVPRAGRQRHALGHGGNLTGTKPKLRVPRKATEGPRQAAESVPQGRALGAAGLREVHRLHPLLSVGQPWGGCWCCRIPPAAHFIPPSRSLLTLQAPGVAASVSRVSDTIAVTPTPGPARGPHGLPGALG